MLLGMGAQGKQQRAWPLLLAAAALLLAVAAAQTAAGLELHQPSAGLPADGRHAAHSSSLRRLQQTEQAHHGGPDQGPPAWPRENDAAADDATEAPAAATEQADEALLRRQIEEEDFDDAVDDADDAAEHVEEPHSPQQQQPEHERRRGSDGSSAPTHERDGPDAEPLQEPRRGDAQQQQQQQQQRGKEDGAAGDDAPTTTAVAAAAGQEGHGSLHEPSHTAAAPDTSEDTAATSRSSQPAGEAVAQAVRAAPQVQGGQPLKQGQQEAHSDSAHKQEGEIQQQQQRQQQDHEQQQQQQQQLKQQQQQQQLAATKAQRAEEQPQQQPKADAKDPAAYDQQAQRGPQPAAAAPLLDVDPQGPCKRDVQHCQDVEPGEGRLADCLAEVQEAADSKEGGDGGGAREDKPALSEECREDVLQFKIKRGRDINNNPALAKACAADLDRFCNEAWLVGFGGDALACLRDARPKLQPACRRQVFRVQRDASNDYRVDAPLHEACEADARALCGDVQPGAGRVQACLRRQRASLSGGCEAELLGKELEDADDIRLSVRLYRACLGDKRRGVCADVAPGDAAAKQCLEEHRDDLSEGCRAEIDGMIEARVRDFRLDSRLKADCEGTISGLCAYLGDVVGLDMYDAGVINCLQDFRAEIREPACQAQVHKYVQLAAQDVRFNAPLADACSEDRTKLCAHVVPGSARVIRCLQNQRDKLSTVCRATLLSEEVKFSENIDFQFPMKQACTQEIERFCKDVPHGNARVIRCLQDNKSEKHFSTACQVEVQRIEQESARDYRLNHRLFKACELDVVSVCPEACNLADLGLCGGKVLACLSENQADIKSKACSKEVDFLARMGVQDFRNDMQLAEACRADVHQFCPAATVEPGEGRVHACLREHADQLSPECRREELRLEEKEADNTQLTPGLWRTCAAERTLFCAGVAPGSARVFRCLAHNMASTDFAGACRQAVVRKLRRREANWRLDPNLREACKEDVGHWCAEEDAWRSQDGAVRRCMIRNHENLGAACARELSRSLHMSFFVWQRKGLLTAPCDADVERLCLSGTPDMEVMPGAVGACLYEIVNVMADNDIAKQAHRRHLLAAAGRKEQPDDMAASPTSQPPRASASLPSSNSTVRRMPRLSEACHRLVELAHPPEPHPRFDVKEAALSALEGSLGRLEAGTGLRALDRDARGNATAITLTGFTALLGVAALVVVILAGAAIGVRQLLGARRSHDGYSLVTKTAPAGA